MKAQADWLCRYNQLDTPTPQFFPSSAKPADYVRAEDLAFLSEQEAQDAKGLAGLGQAMLAAMAPAASAMAEAMAEQTKCEVVTVTINGNDATVALKRTRPQLDDTGVFAKLGELGKAETAELRLVKAKEWVRGATATTTDEKTIGFVKTPQGWRAKYDLKNKAEAKRLAALKAAEEKKKAEAAAEIQELEKKKLDSEGAKAELAKFVVSKARFKKVKQMFSVEPVIELSVKNGTDKPISAVYFMGTLASPGRSVPWLKERVSYKISGGLEPGESANWNLAPNMFSEWGKVEGAPDMVLTVEVLRLDGADGNELYSLSFDDDDQKRLDALRASLQK
ncbi:MAG: hypothetical protein U0228_38690 [Myxococcaceae bacterium]